MGDAGPSVLLEVRDASVTRQGATLLPPISLRIGAGECVAVLGENGAGKTTLLRVLAGRLSSSEGWVRFRGNALDERRRAVRREIASLIEPPAFYPDLTLLEHLRLLEALWSGNARGVAHELVAGLGVAALERFGIAALGDRFAHELSSGQRQLASLAVAFSRPANLLLLDEPEQRLDPDRRALVATQMHAARARGMAIVFASHDASLVDRVADRVVRVPGSVPT